MSWFKKIVTVPIAPSDDAVMIASSIIYDPQDWEYTPYGCDGRSHFFHNGKLNLHLHWYTSEYTKEICSYVEPKKAFDKTDYDFLRPYLSRLIPKPAARDDNVILHHLRNMRGQ